MEDVKTFLRLRGRGSSSLRRLPAFSPVPPNVPSSAKFLCHGLGFWGSQPHFQHGLVEMGCSRGCHTANIRASHKPEDGETLSFSPGGFLPAASQPLPTADPAALQLGLGMRKDGSDASTVLPGSYVLCSA